jgi:hypothetical protein
MDFNELPTHWQSVIKGLHAEVSLLNDGRRVELTELQPSWRHEFSRLRKDNAKHRVQRNEARAEVAALRAERAR